MFAAAGAISARPSSTFPVCLSCTTYEELTSRAKNAVLRNKSEKLDVTSSRLTRHNARRGCECFHSRSSHGDSSKGDDHAAGSRTADHLKKWSKTSQLPPTAIDGTGMKILKSEKELLALKALAKARLSAKIQSRHGTKTSPFQAEPVNCSTAASIFSPSIESPRPSSCSSKGKMPHSDTLDPDKQNLVDVSAHGLCSFKTNSSLPPTELIMRSDALSDAVTDIRDWDSMIDWKMMEHQDYETLPDDQFERLSDKLHIKEKWRPTVGYLLSLGLSTSDLEKVLVDCEELFRRPIGTIMTRVDYLQNDIGFGSRELRKLIDKEPKILLQRNRHSAARCRYLTDIGIPLDNLPKLLRKQPQILQLSVAKGLAPRVEYYKNSLLIPKSDIPKLIQRNPAVLTFSIENQVKPRVDYLRDLGIPKDGVVKMIVKHPHLLHYSFEGLKEHIDFLSSIGMTEEDVVHTVTRLSQIFSLSVSQSLRPKFRYLTEELGGDVRTCVKFPAYFSLSLDQRIRPRHTYMQRLKCAPDPFPMKYLSEKDDAFAGRARRSLEDYISYKVRQFSNVSRPTPIYPFYPCDSLSYNLSARHFFAHAESLVHRTNDSNCLNTGIDFV